MEGWAAISLMMWPRCRCTPSHTRDSRRASQLAMRRCRDSRTSSHCPLYPCKRRLQPQDPCSPTAPCSASTDCRCPSIGRYTVSSRGNWLASKVQKMQARPFRDWNQNTALPRVLPLAHFAKGSREMLQVAQRSGRLTHVDCSLLDIGLELPGLPLFTNTIVQSRRHELACLWAPDAGGVAAQI